MKSDFKLLERVILVDLPTGCELNGKSGFIAGKAKQFEDMYIVWLDVATDTNLAVVVPDSCIEPEPELPTIGGGSAVIIE